MLHNLSATPSALSVIMSELRDCKSQENRAQFRSNLERIGEIIAYEISKELSFRKSNIHTPLGISECDLFVEQPVIVTVLRAGLPFHSGFLRIFNQADSGFISAFRRHKPDGSFDIVEGYITCPDLEQRTVIIADPMLASGASALSAIKQLRDYGNASKTIFASVIAADAGVRKLQAANPEVDIWVGAIDPELDERSYIVPGLGDAGDLAFGQKVQR